MIFKKMFGNKQFYKLVFKVTLPIMAQQILINLVGLVDNLMVGQLKSDIISGVYIAGQIVFIINMILFGSIEGASVFFSQFYGNKDDKHMKQCFNFKIYANMLFVLIGFIVMFFFGKSIANLFVNETRSAIAADYLKIYSSCLIFFAISNVLGTCYREIHKSYIPMIASLIGLVVNISLNYLFIFEHNGMFGWGAKGAAFATVLARICEVSFIFIYTLITKPSFFNNIFKSYKIDKVLAKMMVIKSLPLLLNEFLWSLGQLMLVFVYSKASNDAAASLSISSTFFNLCYIAVIALGDGIAVIVGNTLGSNNLTQARKQIGYFLTLASIIAIVMGVLLSSFAPLVASLYKVSVQEREIAVHLMNINAMFMILFAINCATFFIIRTGGQTAVVLILDSCFAWLIQVPIAFLLVYNTSLSLVYLFLIVNALEIIKLIIGQVLLWSERWIKNLTTIVD